MGNNLFSLQSICSIFRNFVEEFSLFNEIFAKFLCYCTSVHVVTYGWRESSLGVFVLEVRLAIEHMEKIQSIGKLNCVFVAKDVSLSNKLPLCRLFGIFRNSNR